MTFSDIERAEAIAIAELLLGAGRAEMIADCLRHGATLSDVRRLLAAEAAPAAPAPPAAASRRERPAAEAELERAAT
jgi:hypothetical protein